MALKASTKSFLTLALAMAVGAYVGMAVLPGVLPPSKLIPGGG